jgi:hypothetical protein
LHNGIEFVRLPSSKPRNQVLRPHCKQLEMQGCALLQQPLCSSLIHTCTLHTHQGAIEELQAAHARREEAQGELGLTRSENELLKRELARMTRWALVCPEAPSGCGVTKMMPASGCIITIIVPHALTRAPPPQSAVGCHASVGAAPGRCAACARRMGCWS